MQKTKEPAHVDGDSEPMCLETLSETLSETLPERIAALIEEVEKRGPSPWRDRAIHCLSEARVSAEQMDGGTH